MFRAKVGNNACRWGFTAMAFAITALFFMISICALGAGRAYAATNLMTAKTSATVLQMQSAKWRSIPVKGGVNLIYIGHAKSVSIPKTSKGKKVVKVDIASDSVKSLNAKKATYLKTLYCSYDNLSKLDVSKNKNLTRLDCSWNHNLSKLDVSKNKKLEVLMCDNNQLTKLDVSKNKKLKTLRCHKNQLSNLDVSKNTKLKELWCGNNRLSKLDISKNKNLTDLHCPFNELTELDISKNTKLNWLHCNQNNFSPATKIALEKWRTVKGHSLSI